MQFNAIQSIEFTRKLSKQGHSKDYASVKKGIGLTIKLCQKNAETCLVSNSPYLWFNLLFQVQIVRLTGSIRNSTFLIEQLRSQ